MVWDSFTRTVSHAPWSPCNLDPVVNLELSYCDRRNHTVTPCARLLSAESGIGASGTGNRDNKGVGVAWMYEASSPGWFLRPLQAQASWRGTPGILSSAALCRSLPPFLPSSGIILFPLGLIKDPALLPEPN